MITTAVDSTYHFEVEREMGLVLAAFSAPWCVPCKQMAPILEEIAEADLRRSVKVVKVNIEENPDLANRLHVRGVPCLILYKDGRELTRSNKPMAKMPLLAWIKAASEM